MWLFARAFSFRSWHFLWAIEQPPQASARRIALAELPVYRRDPEMRAPETGHPHPMDDSELSRVRNQFNQL
jgi:hypothetical protein